MRENSFCFFPLTPFFTSFIFLPGIAEDRPNKRCSGLAKSSR